MKLQCIVPEPMAANCYILTDDNGNAVLFDPGTESEKIIKTLKNINLQYIILTHGHYDHILGVDALRKAHPEAKIVFPEKERRCLENGTYSLTAFHGMEQPDFKPDVYVSDGDTIEFSDSKIEVIGTPGHTEGGTCYYLEKEKMLFSGDTLFRLGYGRTDFPGSNEADMYRSLKKIGSLPDDTKVYPGHGPETVLSFEKKNNTILRLNLC